MPKQACIVLLALACWLSASVAWAQTQATPQKLRVQLLWSHQAQFAGWYMAEARKHFERLGLAVEILPGGPDVDPMQVLKEGRADMAVAWLGGAWDWAQPGVSPEKSLAVTNVAQFFSKSGLTLQCRISEGVINPIDITGKKIGVWGLGDETMVREMLKRMQVNPAEVTFVRQRPDALDLIDRKVACATAMRYNELWYLNGLGVQAQDMREFAPSQFGLAHLEDGLYVRQDRLNDPVLMSKISLLIQAVSLGWQEARKAPSFALQTVLQKSPQLESRHQAYMLEVVLDLIPASPKDFGLLKLADYENQIQALQDAARSANPGLKLPSLPKIWTQEFWVNLHELDSTVGSLTPSTRHAVSRVMSGYVYFFFVLFGVLFYAFSGSMEAIQRGFDVWGRFVVALVSCVGGGTLRDILIGGDRMPFWYVREAFVPMCIVASVAAASCLAAYRPQWSKTKAYERSKTYCDIIGFTFSSIGGSMIAISANMPWFWVPVCAALSCSGGGVIRAVIINIEPPSLKGAIYEEVALFAAVIMMMGLWIANQFEGNPWPVYLSVLFSGLSCVVLRVLIYEKGWGYASFLPKKSLA